MVKTALCGMVMTSWVQTTPGITSLVFTHTFRNLLLYERNSQRGSRESRDYLLNDRLFGQVTGSDQMGRKIIIFWRPLSNNRAIPWRCSTKGVVRLGAGVLIIDSALARQKEHLDQTEWSNCLIYRAQIIVVFNVNSFNGHA